MPNHDGTGPSGDCCKNKEHRGPCGCGDEHRHRRGAEEHCEKKGEGCQHNGGHHGSGRGCCKDKKD